MATPRKPTLPISVLHPNRGKPSEFAYVLGDKVCHCGHFTVPEGVIVNWYWQTHSTSKCTLELPDVTCWCGLKRSEHIKGHKRRDP